MMKTRTKIYYGLMVLLTIMPLNACKKVEAMPSLSSTNINLEPKLAAFDLEVSNSAFSTEITDHSIALKRDLPFGTLKATVKNISLFDNNTANLKVGDVIDVSKNALSIVVTNNTSKKEAVYSLKLTTKAFASVVEKNGLLRTNGNKIVNKDGNSVSFAGNSFFWSNNGWGGEKYYNASVVAWLALDWDATIVRASMGVDEDGGYLKDKVANTNKLKAIVDAAIKNGLYVLIDWHSHHAEDYEKEAIEFFTEMAKLYGKYDNVMYEIYNEPLKISWSSTLKPYAEAVITAIRKIDPDNMIIVGTPEWSQQVDKPAADPIKISTNIAYTLHFYTKFHQQ
jgi:aryl-phospho-beta-D-glucosidase BglC (GH1 family)